VCVCERLCGMCVGMCECVCVCVCVLNVFVACAYELVWKRLSAQYKKLNAHASNIGAPERNS